MLFSQAQGRRVVSTADADTVGLIDGYVIDPTRQQVVALNLKKTAGSGDVLPWPDLLAFGDDAVTVERSTVVVEADERIAELSGKHHTILRKQVLTTSGQQIGKVQDVDFDPADGRILTLILDNQVQVAGTNLLGVGSYAVVVRS
ncbi:hypothetical protein D1871_03495 [Nakamurella silvestris]|nr:hypothetical protein D1871_03495 [Nakamurella silvestris]